MGKSGGLFFSAVITFFILLLGPALPVQAAVNFKVPAPTYDTGYGPYAVAVGDFNRDGKPDLAVVNNGDSTVTILLGNGSGGFTEEPTSSPYDVIYYPTAIAVGDFNRDGKLDLAVVGDSDGDLMILLGNGDGTFPTSLTDYIDNYAYLASSLVVGDFNRDGILDLAVADYWDGYISIYLGRGDGTFSWRFDAESLSYYYPYGLTIGDFNRDGKLDLAAANYDDGVVSIWLGNGDGTFQEVTFGATIDNYAYSLIAGDFNGDRKLDLAVADYDSNYVSIWLGKGDGTFSFSADYPVGSAPRYIVSGDFNRDRKLDLAVANEYDGTVSILLGTGRGSFFWGGDYCVGNSPYAIAGGDFNRDGYPDLAVVNNGDDNVSILLNILGPYTLVGRVTDARGNGIGGVTITLTLSDDCSTQTVTTNLYGNYGFQVPAGIYTLEAYKTGLSFSPASASVTISNIISRGRTRRSWINFIGFLIQ